MTELSYPSSCSKYHNTDLCYRYFGISVFRACFVRILAACFANYTNFFIRRISIQESIMYEVFHIDLYRRKCIGLNIIRLQGFLHILHFVHRIHNRKIKCNVYRSVDRDIGTVTIPTYHSVILVYRAFYYFIF